MSQGGSLETIYPRPLAGKPQYSGRAVPPSRPRPANGIQSGRFQDVYLDKLGKWVAQVSHQGKQHYLGTFGSESEAGEAVRKAIAAITVGGSGVVQVDEGHKIDLKKMDTLRQMNVANATAAGVATFVPQPAPYAAPHQPFAAQQSMHVSQQLPAGFVAPGMPAGYPHPFMAGGFSMALPMPGMPPQMAPQQQPPRGFVGAPAQGDPAAAAVPNVASSVPLSTAEPQQGTPQVQPAAAEAPAPTAEAPLPGPATAGESENKHAPAEHAAEAPQPTGEAPRPSGGASQPTEEAPQSAGEAPLSAGEASEPTGEAPASS